MPITKGIQLYDYQEKAIENWIDDGYHGIFHMATGTGKTITAICALEELYKNNGRKLAAVIVCPYQHLVEQWVEDLRIFGINPVIGYSNNRYKNYEQELRTKIAVYNRRDEDKLCFITTNASFRRKEVQKILSRIRSNKLLIADEAHNFGSKSMQQYLDESYDYRLGLSATIERHRDKKGTKALLDFFGKISIDYSMKKALENKKLTPYEYYPVITELSDAEYARYQSISKEIPKHVFKNKDGKDELTEKGKILLIQRAGVVAASVSKTEKLYEMMSEKKQDKHMLIYCGAASILQQKDYEDIAGRRQVEEVQKYLNVELEIPTSKFTADESMDERKRIIERFVKNDHMQAIVAIRCLDEGVNIPCIESAYILASTTNPKEYIQRRGRLLRLYPGKEKVRIYDFISLPQERVEETYDESLVKKELQRIHEFGRFALNKEDVIEVFDSIADWARMQEEMEGLEWN